MIYEPSLTAIIVFILFVVAVVWLSSFLAKRTKTSDGYFAAGGRIHWGVNGIAFAGDYLSAASFLGICGMIAFFGYDGFLYSIGYLAGWIVALFVVAEPLKRFGKYTLTDALNYKFNSKGIQFTAAVSTLIVSICYLVPQMVGAGDLVTPLLGFPHYIGVIFVGAIVIFIVATAGMTSTTYVQFIKGGLLITFSTILTIYILTNGISLRPSEDHRDLMSLNAIVQHGAVIEIDHPGYSIVGEYRHHDKDFLKLHTDGFNSWWSLERIDEQTAIVHQALSVTHKPDGRVYYNGAPREERKFFQVGHATKILVDGEEVEKTGPLGPFKFLSTIESSEILVFSRVLFLDGDDRVSLWYQNPTPGNEILRPGMMLNLGEDSDLMSKLNFISLMLALFFGTSALPHILIRYYTVPSPRDARKSTIVAITAIGFFYVLTLFMGLGAMVSGVLDLESSNMAAPLLAKSIGIFIFSTITAIAFATVLGTVAGLIIASSGAVAHDLIVNYLGIKLSDRGQVTAGRISAIGVGCFAIVLGILFKGMNVSFLVGLAFAVAASANLPAILMLLFWKKTTAIGIASSIVVGIVLSLGIIMLSPSTYIGLYGLPASQAPIPLDNPGIISIPLSFMTLVVVSLMTQKKQTRTIA
jgi:cation/acetate symporter